MGWGCPGWLDNKTQEDTAKERGRPGDSAAIHEVEILTAKHEAEAPPEYCPLLHAVGPVDKLGHIDPTGQGVQDVWFVELYVPAEQATGGNVPSGHMYPAGQAVHVVALPREYSPG